MLISVICLEIIDYLPLVCCKTLHVKWCHDIKLISNFLALSLPDEGYYVPDEGYYVRDEGYYVPDEGYYIPDEGYSRNVLCALNLISTL